MFPIQAIHAHGATPKNHNFPPPGFVDVIDARRLARIPNMRGYLRFDAVLRLEMPPTGPRAEPSWFRPWASLNPPNSPFSPLTGPRLLTGRFREAGRLDAFELASQMIDTESAVTTL